MHLFEKFLESVVIEFEYDWDLHLRMSNFINSVHILPKPTKLVPYQGLETSGGINTECSAPHFEQKGEVLQTRAELIHQFTYDASPSMDGLESWKFSVNSSGLLWLP